MTISGKSRRPWRRKDPAALAGDIAHELNNALAPIIISAELLRNKVADRRGKQCLDLLIGSAWRCAAAVRELLAFSEDGRPAAGAAKAGKSSQRRRRPAAGRRRPC